MSLVDFRIQRLYVCISISALHEKISLWDVNSFHSSGQIWTHVQEAARQPLRRGAETPEVPGVCGHRRWGLHCSVHTQGRWRLWGQRRGWGRGPEPVLQHRGLQLHPQRPGWHRGTAWPVRPAADPWGGQRVLQPGAARRGSQHWQHFQFVVLLFLILILVQSEFPAANSAGWGRRQRDPASAFTRSHTSAAGTHTRTAGQSARRLLNNRPWWVQTVVNNKVFLLLFTHYWQQRLRENPLNSQIVFGVVCN